MPSHPRSPLPRPPPLLAPLSTTNSPTSTPLASPLDGERRPLLRTARSFGADDLRRRSHQISDLLFHHGEADAQAGRGPSIEALLDGADGDESDEDDEREGRALSRTRSSFFGSRRGSLSRRRTGGGGGYDGEFRAELEGEGGNGVRSWYGTLLVPSVGRGDTN